MEDLDILNLSATELTRKIKSKEISVQEVVTNSINYIKETDEYLKCFITLNEEEALKRAEEVQNLIDEKREVSPLAGVPMAIVDNICTKNLRTTCSSKMLENFTPVYNATAVDNLIGAGAIILGKLNLDEFAMGSTSETSHFGESKNPWYIEESKSAACGGGAVSVSARQVFYSLASDAGGSIRNSSSCSNVTGLKPTYGRVSRYGLVTHTSSFDQIGPIAKTAKECKEILKIIEGKDSKDSTSVDVTLKNSGYIGLSKTELPLTGLRIGIPKGYTDKTFSNDVKGALLNASKVLEQLGAEVDEISLPLLECVIPTYYILATAEASSNLSRFDGIKYGFRAKDYEDLNELYIESRSRCFGKRVKQSILAGAFFLSSNNYDKYYKKALEMKGLIKKAFNDIFKEYDAILTINSLNMLRNNESPLNEWLGDSLMVAANLLGLPGLSCPCGFDKEGMPIGFQLIGQAYDDMKLLDIAIEFQNITDFHEAYPHFKGVKNV